MKRLVGAIQRMWNAWRRPGGGGLRFPIATKLPLSFLLIVGLTSVVLMAVGVESIRSRALAEAQEKVEHDLNAGREIYLGELRHINDVIRLTASRFFLIDALVTGNTDVSKVELNRVQASEGLDVLVLTDREGRVVFRAGANAASGDDQSQDQMIRYVLNARTSIASTAIESAEDLRRESPGLEAQARIPILDTPMAGPRTGEVLTEGMMLKAAAPVFDNDHTFVGIVYGGVLLNRNYAVVDKIKQTVYQNMQYKGRDIGTATIFLGDVRISTNVRQDDGTRAIGTRISEPVYRQVVLEGQPWIGRAFVVNDWYITAYEPIRDIEGQIIGILYVGMREQRYNDFQRQTIVVFLAVALAGALGSLLLAYFISRRISGPITRLASASAEVAHGNLDAQVEVKSNDELADLASAFNLMARALKERNEELKQFTREKIMESERLALIGQLSANVAHELNNPLQGVVTYSHLLLERSSNDDAVAASIHKIVAQADRCRDIIRGLLDFSRQRKPDKTLCNLNALLQECLSFVENQALFHNIVMVKNFQPELPLVVLDPSQVERVFMNMIINAAEAMNGNGQLSITTRWNPADGFVEVEFRDTGPGIAPENLDRIFDPFFTTKETGHGVGLGLAISHGIVKEHGGSISVESKPDQGTTFLVRLPLHLEEAVADGPQG